MEEKGYHLHHKSLGETIDDDEEDVVDDVCLLDKLLEYIPQFLQRLAGTLLVVVVLAVGGQDEVVVDTQRGHHHAEEDEDGGPGIEHSHHGGDDAGNPYQQSGGKNLGDIVECTLPAYPPGLVLLGQHAHIGAVGSNVVGGTTQCNYGKEGYRDGEEVGEVERDGCQAEDDATDYLGEDYEELLGLVELKQGAPQELQGPG